MADKDGTRWPAKAMSAVIVLLFIAAGARLAWWLLEPLVPLLLVCAGLWFVCVVAFGKFRR